MKGVKIFLADGFEDIEALAVYDVLRRGGVEVSLVTISDDPFVCSSHGVTVGADCFLSDCAPDGGDIHDVMIFPGGMPGSRNLAACRPLISLMREHYASGGTVAAICAAPGLVLGQLDCWEGTAFTCFDGFEQDPVLRGGVFVKAPAVTDGRVITGRSAAYAVDFGLMILSRVKGEEAAASVKLQMKLPVEENL